MKGFIKKRKENRNVNFVSLQVFYLLTFCKGLYFIQGIQNHNIESIHEKVLRPHFKK